MELLSKAKTWLHKQVAGGFNWILTGIAGLVGMTILVSIGGLLANSFTNAAALPVGSAFNVSSTVATYYPIVIVIGYVAFLAMIGIPVIGMIFSYFGNGAKTGGSR